MKNRFREWARSLAALLLGIVVALALAEVFCRVLPIPTAYVRIPMKADVRVGFTREPGSTASNKTLCYDISPLVFNSLGFRGEEFGTSSGITIAVLGDSFMEAVEVPLGADTASILKAVLQANVLNASVASYGTIQELFVFRTFVRDFQPRVVLLFFFAENDIVDNSCMLSQLYAEGMPRPCGEVSDGEIRWQTSFGERAGGAGRGLIRDFLRQHCISCLVAYRFLKYDVIHRLRFGELDFLDNVFRRHPPEQWRQGWDDGWRITEKALLDLKTDVESVGGTLVIVSVPSSFLVIPDWQQVFTQSRRLEKLPGDFDPYLPDRRLKRFGEEQGIHVLTLQPEFIRYTDRFQLKDPFLWFLCDAHWNPVGHFVAANVVARFLIEHDLLPMSNEQRERLRTTAEANLRLSPREILGPTAYHQIYHGGVYTGASNIPQIVQGR